MDVGVRASLAPSPLDLQPVFLEREQQRRHRGVQLGAQSQRIHAEPAERVMRLVLEHGFEVVHDLHRARVQGGGARGPGYHGDVCAFTPSSEGGAVSGDAAADDHDRGHAWTIRRVSATSRLSCTTSSAGLSNLMSGCR